MKTDVKADEGILNIFMLIYTLGGGYKIISRLYKSLRESLKAQHVKNKWEREGGMVISEDD